MTYDQYASKTLLEQLTLHAQTIPNNIAYTFVNSRSEELSITFSELHKEALSVAQELLKHAKPKDRVLLLLDSGLDYATSFWGCLYAGMIAVPLYPPKKNDKRGMLHGVIENCLPQAAIVSPTNKDYVGEYLEEDINLVSYELAGFDQTIKSSFVSVEKNDIAYLQYSSGSTGIPKGAMISHHNLLANVKTISHSAEANSLDVFVNWLPLFHDMGLVTILMTPVFIGVKSVFLSPIQFVRRPLLWLKLLSKHKGSIAFAPNFAYELCATKAAQTDQIKALDLSSWRIACNGAEPIQIETINAFVAALEPTGFTRSAVVPCYGLAEATLFVSSANIWSEPISLTLNNDALQERNVERVDSPSNKTTTLLSVGAAPQNHDIAIVNEVNRTQLEEGNVGEIWISCDSISSGYWNRPTLNTEVFGAYTTDNKGPYFRTGDLGFFNQNELYICGRLKDLIIVNGKNIYPNDVEIKSNQIADEVGVSYCAAIGMANGSSEDIIIFQEIKKKADDSGYPNIARKIQAGIFSAFEVIVKSVVLVPKGSLPKTTSGKIMRNAVKQRFIDRDLNILYSVDETLEEKELIRLWEDVLGVEGIDASDNFFELGGNSFLVMKLMSHLKAKGFSGDVSTLFAARNASELADLLKKSHLPAVSTQTSSIGLDCERITPELVPLSNLQQSHLDVLISHVPGGANNIQDIYPLTALQEGMLFQHLLEAETRSSTYTLATTCKISGQENVERLIQSIRWLIERHDVLRTAFYWDELPRPLQVVLRDSNLLINKFTLDSGVDINDQIIARMQSGLTELDIRKAPLLSLDIAQMMDDYYVIINQHHMINDHIGVSILLNELIKHYRDGDIGFEPAIPYRELIAHTQYIAKRTSSIDFFRQRFADLNDTTLAYGLNTLEPTGYDIHQAVLTLEPSLSKNIRRSAQSLGISTASIFHLAWALVIGHCSQQDNVVFGTVMSGRLHAATNVDKAVGLFINTLPMRIDLQGTIKHCIQQTHDELLGLLEHEHIGLNQIQALSGLSNDIPMFNSLLNYRHSIDAESSDLSKRYSEQGIDIITAADRAVYPLDLSVDDDGIAGFTLTAQVEKSLQPDNIVAYVQCALEAMIAGIESDIRVEEIDILPAPERIRLLREYSQGPISEIDSLSINQRFEAQVKKTPDALALVHAKEQLTYHELDVRANQLAHYLLAQGCLRDELIGIHLDRSVEFIVAIFAILKAGAAYVVLDPANPKERLLQYKQQANVQTIISCRRLANTFFSESLCMDDAEFLTLIASQKKTHPIINYTEHSVAFAYFTSGSTGVPKGALNAHRGVVNNMLAIAKELELVPEDRVLQFASLGFDVVIEEIFPALFSGASVVLRDEEGLLDSQQFQVLLERNHITVCELMAGYWVQWVDYLDRSETCPPPCLRTVLLGSDRVPMSAYKQWQSFEIPIVNVFGLTEAGCTSLVYHASGEQPYQDYLPNGKPLKNTQVYVLNDDYKPVPEGVIGELYIGGIGVGLGYVAEPTLTEQRFIVSPFDGSYLYKTGDSARWSVDGVLEFIGRQDHQVKIRGYRVELGEIETQLRLHSGIANAVVAMRSIDGSEKRLLAWVTANDANQLDTHRILLELESVLPAYMLPNAIAQVDQLPLTSTGKVNYKALPLCVFDHVEAAYEAPLGEIEKIVASIWENILGIQQVGRKDNFFLLGGHSLLIIQLISQLKSNNLHTTVQAVFDNPDLVGLANTVKKNEVDSFKAPENIIPHNCKAITPELLPLVSLQQSHINLITEQVTGGVTNIQDIYPLAPLQEGILFHHMMSSPEQGDTYIMPAILSVANHADFISFMRALNTIVAHHDVLRTSIFWEELPKPLQVVLRDATIIPTEIKLDPSVDSLDAIRQHIDATPLWMNLAEAPLLKVDYAVDPNSEKYYLVIYEHHIVNDHIGLELLIDNLHQLMSSSCATLTTPMPYREFVAHSLELSKNDAVEKYFLDRFSDLSEPTIPFSISNITVAPGEIVEAELVIDTQVGQKIRQHCEDLQITEASFFHLAWALVVARCSDQDEVVFGTTLSGRLQGTDGINKMMGLFINTLPLRVLLTETVSNGLLKTHRELLELLSYEQTSQAFVRGCTALASDAPLFTTLLNYRRDQIAINQINNDCFEIIEGKERTNYPITMAVDDMGEQGFKLVAQVINSLDAMSIAEYLHNALAGMVSVLDDQAEQKLLDMNIMTHDKNASMPVSVDYPQHLLHQPFEDHAKSTPNVTAITLGNDSLTYNEVNTRANQLAHYLIAKGVKPDSLVGLCVERSFDTIIGILAIVKAGGAYVPLDVNYPESRIAYQLQDSEIDIVLTHREVLSVHPALAQCALCLDSTALQQALIQYPFTNPDSNALGLGVSTLAYVIYTSGSTGKPKGVLVEHGHASRLFSSSHNLFNFSNEDVWTLFHSHAFDFSVWEIWGALLFGGRLVIVPTDISRSPTDFYQLITKEKVTVLNQTPSAFNQLMAVDQASNNKILTLRYVIFGGEALAPLLLKPWVEKYGDSEPQLINMYGITETTVHVTYRRLYKTDIIDPNSISVIGKPLPDLSVVLLSSYGQQRVPHGAVGEMYVAGAGVSRGYLNRPELTQKRFIESPLVAGERLYRTGDLARYDNNGDLVYLGRNDQQIKLRGFRIELGEIEAVILSHSAVSACVLTIEERERDIEDERLVAYITLIDKLDADELSEYSKKYLPDYMIPSLFMEVESFPLTINGKIDRQALPKADFSCLSFDDYVAPVTKTEQLLAEIWQHLLGHEKVGLLDNFFNIGGHSLLAIRLSSEIQHHLGYTVSVRDIFDMPVLKVLAEKLDTTHTLIQEPIARIDRAKPLPLSAAQQRLWFIDQLEEKQTTYHISASLHLSGNLSISALKRTFDTILLRHEILRTVFREVNGNPYQVIQGYEKGTLCYQDISNLPLDTQRSIVEDTSNTVISTPFDLAKGPLFRAYLLQLSASEYQLLICMHHIVSDGWSMDVLIKETQQIYAAYVQDQENPLTPLAIQYVDYSQWQQDHLSKDVLDSQLAFWEEHLQSAPALLELPLDNSRPKQQSYRGNHVDLLLEPLLSEKLKNTAAEHDLTLHMLLTAVWGILLSRLSGQDKVTIGIPIANRQHYQLEGLIGFFANTLPLVIDINSELSVRSFLASIKKANLSAYAHQDISFERIVEAIQPERSLGYNPVFQTLFTLQQENDETSLALHDVALNIINTESSVTQFDISLSMQNGQQGMRGSIEYATDLFTQDTIQQWADYFIALLESVATQPDLAVHTLPMLNAKEEQDLLSRYNQTQCEYPHNHVLHQQFEYQVKLTPDATAVIYENQSLTYQALNDQANQIAHWLIEQGVSPDTLVGICMHRSIDMVVSMLAILKAGGAYVPVDPDVPEERLRYQLDDAQLEIILTQEVVLNALPLLTEKAFCVDSLGKTEFLSYFSSNNLDHKSLGLTSAHLAYVIYTSGSTGKPKGVMVEHHSIMNRIDWMQREHRLVPTDKVLQKTPYTFDVSIWEFFLPLTLGAQLVMARPNGHKDREYLLDVIKEQQITQLHFVPSMLRLMLSGHGWEDCHSVKKVFSSGEALQKDLQDQFFASGTCAELHNLYGPTEAAIEVSHWQCNPTSEYSFVPIGKPLQNIELHILDKHLNIVPNGVSGELHIGGVCLARGYLHNPTLTAEKFILNPFDTMSTRLYKTGDVVRRLPDGNIEYVGRTDHQVKIRGFRIELGEIECSINQHDSVNSCVVVVNSTFSGDHLVCYVEPIAGLTVNQSELRAFVKNTLPDYMVPSLFISLDSFPLTSSGKINRKALPAPDLNTLRSENYVTPKGEIENILATIWKNLLGIEKIGRHDNFFDLGGHSLLAIKMLAEVKQRLSKTLTIRSVFESASLMDMAQELTTSEFSIENPIVPVDRSLPLPMSWEQQRLWFISIVDGGNEAYHIPAALHITGSLSVITLQKVFHTIVQRHEILRTTFKEIDHQPCQIINPNSHFKIAYQDVRDLSASDLEIAISQASTRIFSKQFTLEEGPLFRVSVLQLSNTDFRLLLCMHHIVSDAWSMDVLIKEVQQLYSAYVQEQENPLTPLAVHYVDYAQWQHDNMSTLSLDRQLDYWKAHLQDAPALLELPLDRPRPKQQSYRGDHIKIDIGSELSNQLQSIASSQGITLHMLLMTVWGILLSRLSAQNIVNIGVPVANRKHQQLDSLIGFFANTLPLALDINADLTMSELLQQVKETNLSAYAHQDVPFERIVEIIQPERSLGYNPLFQASFNLHQDNKHTSLKLHDMDFTVVSAESAVTQFDITLSLQNGQSGIHGVMEYATDLFDKETIQRWSNHFITLLQSMTTQLDSPVYLIDMFNPADKHSLLNEHNQTTRDFPLEDLIHQQFESQVKANPKALAVIVDNASIDYESLNNRANQVAHYLVEHGVIGDSLVAVCMHRSIDMVVAILGIVKAGGAYVPIDPDAPSARIDYQLQDSLPTLIVTQQAIAETKLDVLSTRLLCLDEKANIELLSTYSQQNPDSHALGITAKNLAYVIYTSGSTGKPKGVMVEHQALLNRIDWMQAEYGLNDQDNVLQKTPYSFDVSVWEFFWPLTMGAKLMMAKPEGHKDPEYLLKTIRQHNITVLHFVPSMLRLMLSTGQWATCESVTHVFSSGEALQKELQDQFFASGTLATLHNLYGPTEATIDVSYWACHPESKYDFVPIGKPIQNNELHVLNKHLQVVPIGVAGELYIGGAGLARGYLRNHELTTQNFIANPLETKSSRLYKTGDLVRRLVDGNVEYLGRTDHQVKIRGFRVELGEIESTLVTHTSIKSCAVIYDQSLGNPCLIAYIEPAVDGILDNDELRRYSKLSLPEYMIPATFVPLASIPLTSSGKIDRKALPKIDASALVSVAYVEPKGETEEALAIIWQELLGIDKIGRHDNFFDIGGHSLLVIKMLSEIKVRFAKALTIRTIFECESLMDVATALTSETSTVDNPILIADRTQPLPMSWAQQRLWFISSLEGANKAYHIPATLNINGDLSVEILEKCFTTIVQRHEVLRTTFDTINDESCQIIHSVHNCKIKHISLKELSRKDKEAAVSKATGKIMFSPFDLSNGPLFRACLLQLSDTKYQLLLCIHHSVSDGWSMQVLINEIQQLYAAYKSGLDNPLTPLTIQYADYAMWQKNEVSQDCFNDQLMYWKTHLHNAPSLLELPLDRPRPSIQSYRGDQVDVVVDIDLCKQLKTLALREGVTLSIILHTAWVMLLSRLSGQDQIVVGIPVANRQDKGLEPMIGLLVNTLALQVDVSGEPTVRELLTRVKEISISGYSHQDIPFERVVDALQPERSLHHNPVFQTLFTLDQSQDNSPYLPGLDVEMVDTQSTVSQFDLSLSLTANPDSISGSITYASDLFNKGTIEQWMTYFIRLLTSISKQPETAIQNINMLTPSEVNSVVTQHNQTHKDYPQHDLIHQQFEDQVSTTPDAIAIIFDGQSLTYRALNQRANQVAHYLIEQGVGPDTLVGICMQRSIDMVVSIMAILKAGGAYVPLAPDAPKARVDYQLQDAKLDIVLTQKDILNVLPVLTQTAVCLDKEAIKQGLSSYSKRNPAIKKRGLRSSHLAYVIYTSGSTGQPKGVMVEHQALVNRIDWMQNEYGLKTTDKVLQKTPFTFDVSVWEFFWPLTQGAQLVIAKPEGHKDREYLLQTIKEQKITMLHFVPSMLRVMLSDKGWETCDSITTVFSSGEALQKELQDRFFACGTNAKLYNLYGPTEAAIDVSYWSCHSESDYDFVPIGKPIQNNELHVLDNYLGVVPTGVIGELYIGGVGLARGYLNNDALTAEKFITNPLQTSSNRLYKTGDVVRRLADGNLEYIARTDHQVKIRGFRVELGEIESALVAHSLIKDVVVISELYMNEHRLIAYVTLHEGDINAMEVRGFLRVSIPEYMIPAAFMVLDTMPLTSNGKVDRQHLPALDEKQFIQKEYTAPEGDTEQKLALIWQQLLRIEHVSRWDNFFDIGGHSLLVTQLVNMIKQEFCVQIPVDLLYKATDFAKVAQIIDVYFYKMSAQKALGADTKNIEKGTI